MIIQSHVYMCNAITSMIAGKTPTRHFKLIILVIRKETVKQPDLYYVSEVSLLTFNMLNMP